MRAPKRTPRPAEVGGALVEVKPVPGGRALRRDGPAAKRLAVIDVGSNSIRLLVAEVLDESSWRVIREERAMTRLAHGLSRSGSIAPESMASSVEAISRFKAICDGLGARARAFATAAVRDAANGADFRSLVKDRAGLTVEVISGLDEGRLTYKSVARAFDLSHGHCAVVDIGGGSMEVVQSRDGIVFATATAPLGAVRLTEAFGGAEDAAGRRFKELRRHCDRVLKKMLPDENAKPGLVVGCGGTFNTLATIAAAERGVIIDRNSPAVRDMAPVSRTQLSAILRRLRGLALSERLRVPGLPADRADIIIAGLCAVERLMERLGVTHALRHPGGVREGLLLMMIDEEAGRGGGGSADDVLAGARAFAARCRSPLGHSEHVAKLAMSLFDQFTADGRIIPRSPSVARERVLLEAAAVLHDIGVLVERPRHHKHSATMIRHAELPGLTRREQEIVAMIARYHRRAEPSKKHAEFAAMPERDRALVRRLAAVLRVADGLDRDHTQGVRGVRVLFRKGALAIGADCAGECGENIRAAVKKGGLLGSVAEMEVEIGAAERNEGVGEEAKKRTRATKRNRRAGGEVNR
ncbi:MAG TPA: Ppx/GppA phosphatase family protein [Phycisphaerales bacterium]|nr:Ppx/GppA phosphatase family protein [Phycisphaerales bacterium]